VDATSTEVRAAYQLEQVTFFVVLETISNVGGRAPTTGVIQPAQESRQEVVTLVDCVLPEIVERFAYADCAVSGRLNEDHVLAVATHARKEGCEGLVARDERCF
jgi:hypothetical protein